LPFRWGSRSYEIISDELNYFRLDPRPAETDLLKYYSEKYFQNEEGNYSASCSELDKSAMEVGNRENGREAFRATVFLEGLISKTNSIDKAHAFHSSLAQIGHGRDITSTFRKKSDV